MITIKDLSYDVIDKDTGVSKYILKHINLRFPKNKVTVITGHNGSGKSTLIKLIMGIKQPSAGRILYGDVDITDTSINDRANMGLTMAFQQPVKFKGLTVRDLIETASHSKASLSNACDYLSQVGLCAKDYIDRELDSTLSGGELKRIELAIALAKGGDVMLFDEPEAGIDLWSFDNLVSIFKKLKNKTVIIVSHQKKILEMADYILLMDSSTGAIIGSKAEMLDKISSTKCSRLEEK